MERVASTLTDGDLLHGGGWRSIRQWWDEASDRLAGSDPGLTQLRTTVQAVGGMALAVVGAYFFVSYTHALELPAGALPPAALAAQHHAVLVVGMLLAALTAMVAGFVVNEPSGREHVAVCVLLPVPLLAAMTIGFALGPWPVAGDVWLVIALMGGVYVRRFGPRGFGAGMVMFNGAFLGYFLGRTLSLSSVPWLAAEVYVGVVAALVLRFAVIRTDPAKAFVRMRRSYAVRGRKLIDIAVALTEPQLSGPQRARLERRLTRALTRLNEATLMIDAQLADPATGREPFAEHQRLFDLELHVSNTCRFAAALCRSAAGNSGTGSSSASSSGTALSSGPSSGTALSSGPSSETAVSSDPSSGTSLSSETAPSSGPTVFADVRTALEAARHSDAASAAAAARRLCAADAGQPVLVDRFAQSVASLIEARAAWSELAPSAVARAQQAARSDAASEPVAQPSFTPAVGLTAGFLPGSGPVAEEATRRRGTSRWFDTAVMPVYLRSSIQIGVAATIAILVGGLLSQQRLYWALLATFLAFLATTNSGEQVRKALYRVGGTAIGIVVGALVVHLTGGNIAVSFVIIGVALFLGVYLIRVNYTFMVIGITVSMSLLYVQLGEFSWSLLVLRLEETAIGVAAVVLVVVFVVPLRPQRVITAGVLLYVRALRATVDRALDTVTGDGEITRLDIRALDATYQSLDATLRPLRRATFGRNSSQLTEIVAVTSAARYYTRNLATGVHRWPDSEALDRFRPAAAALRRNLDVIDRRVAERETAPYVRSAARFDLVERALPSDAREKRLALRDLMLLDGALARLAGALCLPVHDLDTQAPAPPVSGPDNQHAATDHAQGAAGADGSASSRHGLSLTP